MMKNYTAKVDVFREDIKNSFRYINPILTEEKIAEWNTASNS